MPTEQPVSKSNRSIFYRIIISLLGLGLLIFGIKVIYDANNPTYYSITYIKDKKENIGPEIIFYIFLGIIFLVAWVILTKLFIRLIKVLYKHVFRSLFRNAETNFLTSQKSIIIQSSVLSLLSLLLILSYVGFQPMVFPSIDSPVVSLDVTAPTQIKANEPFEIIAVLLLNEIPQGPVYANRSPEHIERNRMIEYDNIVGLEIRKNQNKIESKNKNKIKPKNIRDIQYEATTRLQSGFTVPSPLQNWQDKKKITLTDKPEWRWILTPSLDRFGKQPVLVEGLIFGTDGKIIAEPKPVSLTIEVQTPLGLPWWLGYGLTLVGGLSLFAWTWDFIKEKWLKKESSKALSNPLGTSQFTPEPPSTVTETNPSSVIEENKKSSKKSKFKNKKPLS